MKGWQQATLIAALVGSAGAASAFEREDLSFGADITAQWDDNQSQAQFERDQVEDQSLLGSVMVGYDHLLARHTMLKVMLQAEQERPDEIDTLKRTSVGGRAALRWQPSSAFTAPIVEWNVSWRDDDVETDARDATVTSTQLFVTRRLTDRITTTLGAEYRRRESEGSVWDLKDARGFVNLDYLMNASMAAYLTYSYLEGDIASSAQRSYCNGAPARDLLPLIGVATAKEPDEAYNNALCGDWLAYRLDANSHVYVMGVNYGFSHSLSVDVSVLHADVTAREDSDVNYERQVIRASLLKRF